ncbi:hypothetical protein [Oryza sativa Japonica Group]|uniref:Uncharacterized protein OJ1656_A11.32 n=1 Tax=Oryza sativa subsp. japonica TaxID=39947 RepID=Q5JLF4_ORYSJ|nr:hypothetical protein [Oryza sativa Japonica Group]
MGGRDAAVPPPPPSGGVRGVSGSGTAWLRARRRRGSGSSVDPALVTAGAAVTGDYER